MTNKPNTAPKPIDRFFARGDYAGETVANVAELRARSYDALPGIFARCVRNPEGFFCEGEFAKVLLARHAQEMFIANDAALQKVLTAQPLTKQDVDALTWLRSAAESFAYGLEELGHEGQLWVPGEVERLLAPFDDEVPF